MKKTLISLGAILASLALVVTSFTPGSAGAQTMTPISASCYTFNQNLGFGQPVGPQDAQGLAIALTRARLWNPTVPLVAYTQDVMYAVQAFQNTYASELLAPYGYARGLGNVDNVTRAKLNTLYGCGGTTTPTPQNPQAVVCPLGFICTPNPALIVCPLGYVCTPIVTTPPASTSTATTTAPSVSFSLSGSPSIYVGSSNQFGQSSSLVATFQLNVTSRGGTLAMPQSGDFVVVFRDSSGNSYAANSTSVSVAPNSNIGSGSTSVVTVTAQIPASSLPSSGLYTAAISSFRWNQDGTVVTQTYGLEDLRTSTSASFVK